jgi:hypothetical protein
MARKMKQGKNLEDLVDTIIHHKNDILFNRQLRIHRENIEFRACFMKTNEFVGDAILPLWSKIMGLKNNSHLSRIVLRLSLENFMLQITPTAFDRSWLRAYFMELQMMVKKLRDTKMEESD